MRLSKGITNTPPVPSADARNGILHDSSGNLLGGDGKPIPGNAPFSGTCPINPTTGTVTSSNRAPGQAGFCVDASATKYLEAFYPLPSPGTVPSNGNLGTFGFPTQQVVSENFVTTRVDHKFSEFSAQP